MSVENSFEHESSPESGGVVAWIKGTRLAKALHKLNSGRYEECVPEEIREFAESRGVPKPITFVPSIEGRRVRIPTQEE